MARRRGVFSTGCGYAWYEYLTLDFLRPRTNLWDAGIGNPLAWGVFQQYYKDHVFPDASEVSHFILGPHALRANESQKTVLSMLGATNGAVCLFFWQKDFRLAQLIEPLHRSLVGHAVDVVHFRQTSRPIVSTTLGMAY